MFHWLRRCLRAALILVAFMIVWMAPALSTNTSAFLSGTVTQNGKPVAGASVTATGNNRTYKTTSDKQGRFQFPPFGVGTYTVEVTFGDSHGLARVDLGTGGATISIPIGLKEIAAVAVTSSNTVRGSGSDTVLNSTSLTEMPYNNSFTEMQIQLPGSVRGANGVVHFNGDHGVINYQIDGVALPQELNRDIGGEINLNDLSFVDFDRRRVSGAVRHEIRSRLQHVDASRHGAGRIRRQCFSYGSYGTREFDDWLPFAARRWRWVRHRAERYANHARARSARFRLAT